MNLPLRKVDALLFDKDGTLFDFQATWGAWAGNFIERLSDGNAILHATLVEGLHYDLAQRRFHPTSPFIACTHFQVVEQLSSMMPHRTRREIDALLTGEVMHVPQIAAVPLRPLMAEFAKMGLRTGVMTNDAEENARANLDSAGVTKLFDMIIGSDSGYGCKPEPEPLLAFAEMFSLDPESVAMVGDSTHDLLAGRDAGMQTIGVLTGTADTAELAPYADVVLPDIGHIPEWLRVTKRVNDG